MVHNWLKKNYEALATKDTTTDKQEEIRQQTKKTPKKSQKAEESKEVNFAKKMFR